MPTKGSEEAAGFEPVILRHIRAGSGLSEPGVYQFEDLYIDEDERQADGSRSIRFRYVFDEDGSSQYDKTIAFSGRITIDAEEQVVSFHLKLEHVGVAAHYEPPAGLADDSAVKVRLNSPAGEAAVPAIAEVLAKAFFDDPFCSFVMPDAAARSAQLGWSMSCLVRYGLRSGRVYTAGQPVAGAAIWLGPDRPTASLIGLARAGFIASSLHFGIGELARVLQVARGRRFLHRRKPSRHWYLMILGVDPERQGSGIGTALLQPVLDEADRDGMICHLGTMKAKNVAFYERSGFEVMKEGRCGPGLSYWDMRRSPR